jgi:HAD superfamily hydrolase (TIGR01509 family)
MRRTIMQAVLFDLDGVIIDTERNGHRVAFNEAFQKCGYPGVVWDEELYHRLLQVGGGKERIRYYFDSYYQGDDPPGDMDEFVKDMHKLKTNILVEMLPKIPLRPGVHRIMCEFRDMGIKIGMCTTSNEKAAKTVAEEILADIPFSFVIAGDMVKKKKPDPEIYQMALDILELSPDQALVIEDSHIGVQAGKAAGCTVLATYNGYTEKEDLSPADFIVSCLGDPEGEKAVIKKASHPIGQDGVIKAIEFM